MSSVSNTGDAAPPIIGAVVVGIGVQIGEMDAGLTGAELAEFT